LSLLVSLLAGLDHRGRLPGLALISHVLLIGLQEDRTTEVGKLRLRNPHGQETSHSIVVQSDQALLVQESQRVIDLLTNQDSVPITELHESQLQVLLAHSGQPLHGLATLNVLVLCLLQLFTPIRHEEQITQLVEVLLQVLDKLSPEANLSLLLALTE